MRLCIYEADRPTPEHQIRFGSYADMFESWLSPAMPEARFSRVFVSGGEALPRPETLDAVLITGSRAGVHDGADWIADLKTHLVELRLAGVPMGGICFGHQIMAESFGGRVARAPTGWTIGRHLHTASPTGERLFGKRALAALSFHQDQVVVAPPGTEVLMSTRHSPQGGFRYDFSALSVQVHPELEQGYIQTLLGSTAVASFPEDVITKALTNLSATVDGDAFAQGFARFFRECRQTSHTDLDGAGSRDDRST